MRSTQDKAIISIVFGVLGWTLLGPRRRRTVGEFLGQIALELQLAEQEKERQMQILIPPDALEYVAPQPDSLPQIQLLPIAPPLFDFDSLTTQAESLPITPIEEPDARLRSIVMHPSIVLILGKRGSGKSAIGYRILELFRYALTPYVVGVPSESAGRYLPDWIGIVPSLEDLPRRSIALIDEAYIMYHSRRSMAEHNREMSEMLNLSRQREQTLLFVSQEARQVDRNIASSANVVIFKEMGMLQQEFDRPELRQLVAEAKHAIEGRHGDRRRWAFIFSPDTDFKGIIETKLATFWKPSLSRLFSGNDSPASQRGARKLSLQERTAKAIALRSQGYSYGQIANILGVSKSTIVNYLRDYPYKSQD